MAFTDITSTASVRSVLGISERELRDEVLLNPIYSTQLHEKLYDLHVDLFGDFTDVAAIDPRSEVQDRFYNLVQAYSAYAVASFCLGSLPMFSPQTIKDSKSELSRFDDANKNLRRDVLETLSLLRIRLLTVYNAINPDSPLPSATARLSVLIAPLGVNPVTG